MKIFTSADVKGGSYESSRPVGLPDYEVQKDRSGLVLTVGLILVALVIFALTHIEEIKGLLA